jgi:hypothetical protein
MFGALSPAFEPTAVQTMADALDQAWAVMEGTGTMTPQHRLETRLALANRIIELASYGDCNTRVLRDAALASMTEQHASALQHSSAASATTNRQSGYANRLANRFRGDGLARAR